MAELARARLCLSAPPSEDFASPAFSRAPNSVDFFSFGFNTTTHAHIHASRLSREAVSLYAERTLLSSSSSLGGAVAILLEWYEGGRSSSTAVAAAAATGAVAVAAVVALAGRVGGVGSSV